MYKTWESVPVCVLPFWYSAWKVHACVTQRKTLKYRLASCQLWQMMVFCTLGSGGNSPVEHWTHKHKVVGSGQQQWEKVFFIQGQLLCWVISASVPLTYCYGKHTYSNGQHIYCNGQHTYSSGKCTYCHGQHTYCNGQHTYSSGKCTHCHGQHTYSSGKMHLLPWATHL